MRSRRNVEERARAASERKIIWEHRQVSRLSPEEIQKAESTYTAFFKDGGSSKAPKWNLHEITPCPFITSKYKISGFYAVLRHYHSYFFDLGALNFLPFLKKRGIDRYRHVMKPDQSR